MFNSYFNPSPKLFMRILRNEYYVDKTDLIIHLNNLIYSGKNNCVCVSRPRRFGKTITANMLVAYYRYISEKQKKTEAQDLLFKNKKLQKYKDWKKYLGKFNVIKLDMYSFFCNTSSIEEGINSIKRQLIKEIKRSLPDFKFSQSSDELDISNIFDDIYYNTKLEIVLIIDEWDFVIRDEYENNEEAQKKYIKFLTKITKDKNYIVLAYMTGILPTKQCNGQSFLGYFKEFSMTSPCWMAKYVGFTEEEVEVLYNKFIIKNEKTNQILSPKRRKLNKKLNENKNKITTERNKKENLNMEKKEKDSNMVDNNDINFKNIQKWYKGYVLKNEKMIYHIYTPLSIMEALENKKIKNYWNRTETYEALSIFINLNFDGLKEDVAILMKNKKVTINIETYKNDITSFKSKDDVLTMLIHLGYLGYLENTKEVFIPNEELKKEFKNCIECGVNTSVWTKTIEKLERSQELLEATWACDKEKIAELVEVAHDNASNNTYNSEAALRYSILLAYYKANDYYTILQEFDSGKGFADIIFIPIRDKPALVVELKYNKNPNGAIKQITNRNYPKRLEHYKSNILLIGINYDKNINNTSIEYKHHSCEIERYSDES